jgi:gamma-glutamyltranspeptidase / glutathione hydrolase
MADRDCYTRAGKQPSGGNVTTRSEWIIDKTEVQSDEGIVCAHHLAAAEAGAAMLAKGGNAVDAAVAAGFAVGVAEPYMSGVGGICQLVYREAATGRTTIFDGTSVLPHRIRPELFPLADPPSTSGMYSWPAVEGDTNNTGWLSPAVPGTPACLLAALSHSGTLPRRQVLAPAIRLAADGVEVDWDCALAILTTAERIRPFPATRAIYFRASGLPLVPDSFSTAPDFVRQPDLARTLEALADEGPAAFYRGDVAHAFAEQMAANGGLIDLEDLAAYQVRIFADGVRVAYRDVEVTVVPETGGGLTVAEALKILDRLDLRSAGFGSADALHLMIETQRRAFLDRFRHLGDPTQTAVPYDGLFSNGYGATRRAEIDRKRATPDAGAGDPWVYQTGDARPVDRELVAPADVGHTTQISVIDRHRNMVSLTSTLGAIFGSGVVVPGTGILLNSGATWFDPRPGSHNSIAPGRRILWAGSPSLVTRNGRPFAAIGAPGGRKVISAVLQVIVNLVEFGMGMQEAISAPRVHCEGRAATIDSRFGEQVLHELSDRGHDLNVQTETFSTSLFGRPNGVLVDPASGRLRGGVNPFKPYFAVGL